jgi:hypothetical protein
MPSSQISENIFLTRYDLSEKRTELYDQIISDTIKIKLSSNMNVKWFEEELSEFFLKECEGIFGKLELSKKYTTKCYAFVYNKHFSNIGFVIHDHVDTATINGAYYLNVPEVEGNTGKISFYDDNESEVFSYQPKTFDFLIFPGWLKHRIHRIDSEEFRITINTEILCNDVWK